MRKLVFKKESKADAHIVAMDAMIGGFPEDLNLLRYIGVGIHAPKEVGRALHYCEKWPDKKNKRWALYHVEATEPPEDPDIELVDELPEDWWDEEE